ncbi:AraC-like ligand binding domain-containing protein [Humidesulfovibrio mexicanus]|uniref:AraC-like ligand binding domain-containing protein n=2 Tax=Humidesulfovibrio mexicanus TaxID=147047 RepID=A0A238ZA43_9BACT|nr:AraC-like ligand binding domain-containing protein [Humidesulfovibrio mexicanus]
MADRHPPEQPRHAHDSLTVGLVTNGTRSISTAEGHTQVALGEVFSLPQGLAHSCTACGPCAYLAFSFTEASLPLGFPTRLPLRIADAGLAACLAELAACCERAAGALEIQSMLAEVLERLADHGVETPCATRPDREEMTRAVATAREIIEKEDGQGVGLEELAQSCGVDAYALHRAFTRLVGLPPHAFQTHARLRRAKRQLREGMAPAEAAIEAGFCDQSHLNRHFARVVGLTPAQYARAYARRKCPPL